MLLLLNVVTTSLNSARKIRLIINSPLLEICLQICEGGFAVLTIVPELHFEAEVCYGSFSFRRVDAILSLIHYNLLKFIWPNKIYVSKCTGSYSGDP